MAIVIKGGWLGDYLNPDPGNYNPNDPQYQIYGFEGDDEIHGGDNSDFIDGGTGADYMAGWGGNDTYVVDNAGDVVHEVELHGVFLGGIDTVYASINFTLPDFVENLSLMTSAGAINGAGNELDNVIHGNESGNTLTGGDGADLLIGHGGSDTLRGGNQNDRLFGSEDNDTLEGGSGDDELDGGTGADTMRGGSGNDYYQVDNIADVVTENANEGIDTVYSRISFTLGANVENLVLVSGTGAIDGTGNALGNQIFGNESANELRGNDGEDLLKGGGGADVLRGGNQNDELYGEGGDDELRGDGGDDDMYGGTGNDTYSVNSVGDQVIEFAGEGTDTVNSSLDAYTLTADVENLVLTAGVNGTGNNLANRITGNILDNVLDGAGGGDTLEGRLGNDTYVIDEFGDVVIELAGQGFDTVIATATGRLTPGSELEVLRTSNPTGTAAINLFGNEFANTITGNDGDNTISGGGDADVMTGRLGNDTYVVDNAGDVVTELANQGVDKIITSITLSALAANVENLTMTGTASINANGNGLDNIMLGNSGQNTLDGGGGRDELRGGDENDFLFGGSENDTLFGDGGSDRLVGSLGADKLTGGAGADSFEFRSAQDSGFAGAVADEILDFSSAQGDKIDLAQIDANSLVAGDQAFTFIGNNNAFTGVAGQLRFNAGQLEGDLNGDGAGDFRIQVNVASLVAADFVL
jgi:Ca2+-binding RTX toxin-like protein